MALPININELLTGKTVEWERLEFKAGWNPLEIIQSISAFANDINNWGGGYIVLGIEDDKGRPKLPPKGLEVSEIDSVQKKLLDLCHKIRPAYFPIVEPVIFQNKHILIMWVPGGSTRPYQAPDKLTTPCNYYYYIRRFSSTKRASEKEQYDLLSMSARIPFDDQINQRASLSDLSLNLIKSHLSEVGSDLLTRIDSMPFSDLCRKMNIAEGPDEYLKPKNVGLLFFNDNPTKYFQCAQIDLVEFKNDVGDKYTEKIFNGPVQQQLRDALVYFKNHIVIESVLKVPGKAESLRFYNYPFEAFEEALVNTVFHRSYQDDSPIEIRIFPDRLEMISYPGPLPPLNKSRLLTGNIIARKYRNRRIGDFLKELHLTEGRGTGIPKIKKTMAKNGSPPPIFDTDDELTYFLTVLPIHASWSIDKDLDKDLDIDVDIDLDKDEREKVILEYCLRPKKRKEIFWRINLYNNHTNFISYIKPLLDKNYLELTIPDKPTSGNQEYKTTHQGQAYLKTMSI